MNDAPFIPKDFLKPTERDIDAMVRTVAGEIRGGDFESKLAVAWVIINRAKWHPAAWWGSTIYDVCHHPYQFSCWNKNDPNSEYISKLDATSATYLACEAAVEYALNGNESDPTKGSTSYLVHGTHAKWLFNPDGTPRPTRARVGPHDFYYIDPAGSPT